MANLLKIIFGESMTQTSETSKADSYEYRNKPFANSPVHEVFIESFQLLTDGIDVKTVYQLKFSFKDIVFDFLPGDVIAILPENNETEVNELLERLNLKNVCHNRFYLEVLNNTKKKNATIPKHLPQSDTLNNIFLKHIDIRTVPKKLFLKSLIKYTNDSAEREKLEFICSPFGSKDYIKLLEDNRSLLSLLNSFPSCNPPIELILEHSTPLNPRYFSIASSPLSDQLAIIFYVLNLESGLKGVCTGWLENLIKSNDFKTKTIPIYFRKPGNFRLNVSKPNILIATGTGLAPFLGFLEHKKLKSVPSSSETWLFYGCRYSTRDFLSKELLKSYLDDEVLTKLYKTFSREGVEKQYIQHRIAESKDDVMDLIWNKEAFVFVCGDTKTVVKDVKELFINCFMEYKNVDRGSAEALLSDLIKDEKIVVDSWI